MLSCSKIVWHCRLITLINVPLTWFRSKQWIGQVLSDWTRCWLIKVRFVIVVLKYRLTGTIALIRIFPTSCRVIFHIWRIGFRMVAPAYGQIVILNSVTYLILARLPRESLWTLTIWLRLTVSFKVMRKRPLMWIRMENVSNRMP